MFVIVVGCGKIGYHLSRALLSANHEVVIIERDAARAAMAADDFGSIVISSDGTEPTVLTEAGVERCDLLIATTAQDATNLVACQVAKRIFNVPQTLAVVTDPEHAQLFTRVGVDATISATELILAHIEEGLQGGPLVHVLQLADNTNGIVCVRIPGGSPVIGRSVGNIGLPPGTAIAAVVAKNGEIRKVADDLQIQGDDQVVAITPPEREGELWRTLTGSV